MANNGKRIFSVKGILKELKGVVEGSVALRNVCVRGEISSFDVKSYISKYTHQQEHYFRFTLKEGENISLNCVMFGDVDAVMNDFEARGITLGVGLSLVCEGNIEIYENNGFPQLKCHAISADGAGASAAALEALKKRLREEGLFEQNRDLPKFPKKIAVVTSKTGAVVHDIKTTVERRYPITEIVVIHATVQGENAVPSLIAGLEKAQTTGADVIIFGRGGGSSEDLYCFNDERLARAIFASRIPTISAVGHETDVTIADFVADKRAPTPTGAAELAVPDVKELLAGIAAKENSAARSVKLKLAQCDAQLLKLSNKVQGNSPRGKIAAWSSRLESAEARLKAGIRRKLDKSEHDLNLKINTINGVNPLAVLSRGYSVATKGGKAIKSSSELSVGDVIEVKLNEGEVTAEVTKITN